jgi:hypothetical protein
MANAVGLNTITGLRQRWVAYNALSVSMMALAATVLYWSIFDVLFGLSAWWCLVFFMAVLITLSYFLRPFNVTNARVSSALNSHYPELQESCALVMKPHAELNLLETLQYHKVDTVLQQLNGPPPQLYSQLKQGALFSVLLLALSLSVVKTSHLLIGEKVSISINPAIGTGSIPEKVLPQISGVAITITPPYYTRRPKREQDRFTLVIEEGGLINWVVKTNISVKSMNIIFNEKQSVALHASRDNKSFSTQKSIINSGFYQLNIDGKLSDLYQIQVIKDKPPVISIIAPKAYTHIDAGEAPKININSTISDDYGVQDALIMATVAKGSGESVKFKEYKIPFATTFGAHQQKYNVQKLINLPALNMEPGDELYFYIQATDTYHQQSKTDVYTVAIQDTAQLLSMDGIVSGVDLKPEFFRSERQIILDSERLLKEKDTIDKKAFDSRSNDLATDQKLLRLRYGKFLGEEDESSVGDNKAEGLADPNDFSNANKIRDAYTDKHDNAEDATFFDPTLKAQLKATLNEMWRAELHLRMYKPQDAIPFEYKALRLIKDLQQKSRSYVAKTAYNPPPLKLEKRLTGDLNKINQPANHTDVKPTVSDAAQMLNNAAPVMDKLSAHIPLTATGLKRLQLAGQQLSSLASTQPAQYLSAVNAMHRLLKSPARATVKDIGLVEVAIQKAMSNSPSLPQKRVVPADMGLSNQYYKNLNQINR